jgi:hypothetical protein
MYTYIYYTIENNPKLELSIYDTVFSVEEALRDMADMFDGVKYTIVKIERR